MAIQRRKAAATAVESGQAASDLDTAVTWPNLVEFLTLLAWPDGEKRKTGTVMILAENGVFKAWVHDRDGARSAWLSGGSLFDLAASLEESLQSDSLTWRDDSKGGRK